MDNLEDIVVPIIIGIVFLLQAIFGRKKPNGEDEDGPTAADDPSDQFRKIREEIQRRIEENRRKQEGGASPAAPHQPAGSQRIPTMRPASSPAPAAQRPAAAHRPAATHEVSGAERMRQMQAQIDEARKRARQDELRAAAIRRETEERASAYGGYSTRSAHPFQSTADLVESVVSDLQDPVSARKALLFSEIFGAPVGLRSSGASRPLLEK